MFNPKKSTPKKGGKKKRICTEGTGGSKADRRHDRPGEPGAPHFREHDSARHHGHSRQSRGHAEGRLRAVGAAWRRGRPPGASGFRPRLRGHGCGNWRLRQTGLRALLRVDRFPIEILASPRPVPHAKLEKVLTASRLLNPLEGLPICSSSRLYHPQSIRSGEIARRSKDERNRHSKVV